MKVLNKLNVGGSLQALISINGGLFSAGVGTSQCFDRNLNTIKFNSPIGSINFDTSYDKQFCVGSDNNQIRLSDCSDIHNITLLDTLSIIHCWAVVFHTSLPIFALTQANGLSIYDVSSKKFKLICFVKNDAVDSGYSLGSIINDNNILYCTYANRGYIESFDFSNPYYTQKIRKEFIYGIDQSNSYGHMGLRGEYVYLLQQSGYFYRINKNTLLSERLFRFDINNYNLYECSGSNSKIHFLNDSVFFTASNYAFVSDIYGNMLDVFDGSGSCNSLFIDNNYYAFNDGVSVYSVLPQIQPIVNGVPSYYFNTRSSNNFFLKNMYRPISLLGKYKS